MRFECFNIKETFIFPLWDLNFRVLVLALEIHDFTPGTPCEILHWSISDLLRKLVLRGVDGILAGVHLVWLNGFSEFSCFPLLIS